jgi:hypothetical protein
MNKVYEGVQTAEGASVTADGQPLDPRFDLRNHSPTGFSWGFAGSGPAQLSLALLADATEDDDLAQSLYQQFKFEWVAAMNQDRFLLTQAEIRSWIAEALRRDRY